MHLIKKSLAVVLFVSLIACFVLYRMDYFQNTFKTPNETRIVTNQLLDSDVYTKGEKRLIIDHEIMLIVDTIQCNAFRTVKKKFILEDFSTRIIPSSKSIILGTELPNFATKNKKVLKRLQDHNIVRVNFTSNRGLKSAKSDASLLEALELLDKDQLKVGSRIERYIFDDNTIDIYWKVTNNIVTVEFVYSGPELLVNRTDVDEFLEWYEKFEKREPQTKAVISSSKSLVTTDKATLEWLNEKRDYMDEFKTKLSEYLNIKF